VFQPDYTQAAVWAFAEALQLFGIGASWGGYESLALPTTGFISRTAGSGAFGGQMLRLHIGLEATEDLIADLDQALGVLRAHDADGSGVPTGDA
jgi:cystathionine beta-lyase